MAGMSITYNFAGYGCGGGEESIQGMLKIIARAPEKFLECVCI